MEKVELSLALFSFIIPFCLLSNTAISVDPLFTFCSNDTSNYQFNSTFENNLKYVLESLISNTSLTGFNTTFIGESPDRVYGQALCRGDINSTVCHSCIKSASEDVLKVCKSREAIIWYEQCQVHYSFQMFFLTMVYTGKFPDWDSQQSYLSNPAHFNEVLMYLMNNLSSEAANVPEKNMFATGEIKLSRSKTIYGLVQCTRDISEGDCSVCLKNAFGDLDACCYSQEGGIVLSRNCNARFQLDRFYNSSSFLVIYPASKGNNWKTWVIAAIACISTLILAVLTGSFVVCIRNRRRSDKDKEKCELAFLNDLSSPTHVAGTQESDLTNTEELPFFDLVSIIAATENFSDSNKLGQGGFGAVYKGVLSDGKEIAVKRLSRTSRQGSEEFKNEVKLIAKLQHRNLVRLLGYGIEGDEKLLIYEFMPNRSLDIFIFDFERRPQLDWKTSYNILCGIARGLLYLHEDSRLKIIHRDLKPSNVLLDHEMAAKISDFGMARIFGQNQNTANTRRIVGTYGYMAPEYAMEGLFSVKSDVFSFGVILLEIISGKRNNGFFHTEHSQTLLAYAWRLWKERKALELADPFLMGSCQPEEVLRCIHIGLLCVQEDPADRPNMSYVVALLGNSSISLPEPGQPAFSFGRAVPIDKSSSINPSGNEMTLSIVSPR